MIVSRLPVLEEVLTHGENCLLAAPDNAGEWRSALEQLRDNSALRQKLADRAREIYLEKYTWEKRAERTITKTAGRSKS
jgi:glycosyltransferase involved in cell wall biosynthesis